MDLIIQILQLFFGTLFLIAAIWAGFLGFVKLMSLLD